MASMQSRESEKQSKEDLLRKHESVVNIKDLEKLESHDMLFGMDLETRLKRDAQYQSEWGEKEREVLNWIETVTQEHCDHLFLHLKSGRTLCKLMNALRPGSVKKINKQKVSFMERENIQSFCNAAIGYGLAPEDVFSVDSLYDARDLISVMRTLLALERRAPAHLQSKETKEKYEAILKKKQPVVAVKEQERSFGWRKLIIPFVLGLGSGIAAVMVGEVDIAIGVSVGVSTTVLLSAGRYLLNY